ncbi:peptide-methionine (S)-S-oxide reductase MsrA [Nitrosomonas supralitoralis]|uniref:Peptide methionine sulfoxide reductase MsrA n=1 Tax=Nitrosomonas supralitoralis TaxID=2116706 RepID=A0A2P7NYJ6_9PROT|nr:peptide-methionine (S)-S-oxide reductase MsrA [Nitrosomonas supralitoralis]PSJ18512.1 peptide-methionine (S)-S-oxide reductase [Nitrosomonas supralitoralis]
MTASKIIFGAGCFWGVEATFRRIKGVTNVICGYSGGHTVNPTYTAVCTGTTGHIEVVLVEYDSTDISIENLLDKFWNCHDPTTQNRQGPDIGEQYRSVIFYFTPEQEKSAKEFKDKLQTSKRWKDPIVTEILPAGQFYVAEEYHQDYFTKHGIY